MISINNYQKTLNYNYATVLLTTYVKSLNECPRDCSVHSTVTKTKHIPSNICGKTKP